VTEEVARQAQVLDVRATLTTTGEHEQHLGQDLASVVQWRSLTSRHDPPRKRMAEAQTIGKDA
jgi:hypothetical protein